MGKPQKLEEAGVSESDVRLIRMAEVCHLTSMSRSTVYAKVAAGKFPKPVNVHGRLKAWKLGEVQSWIENLEAVSTAKASAKKRSAGQ